MKYPVADFRVGDLVEVLDVSEYVIPDNQKRASSRYRFIGKQFYIDQINEFNSLPIRLSDEKPQTIQQWIDGTRKGMKKSILYVKANQIRRVTND